MKDATFALRVPLGLRCPADDTFELPFAGIDTQRQKSWAMTFDEKCRPSRHLQDAERAGMKRLFARSGRQKLGAIDAKPDKAADAAMAAFRKRLNINPNASTSDLFDALETQALKTTAPAGYAVCNDTAKAIWAALGLKTGQMAVARVVEDRRRRLREGHRGSAVDRQDLPLAQTPGGIPIVYGPEKFCTTGIEFEIQGRGNCKSRGWSKPASPRPK